MIKQILLLLIILIIILENQLNHPLNRKKEMNLNL